MKKEIIVDIIFWNNDEPKIILSKEYYKNHCKYLLFDKLIIWKKRYENKRNCTDL